MKDINPKKLIAYIMDLYPQRGLRVLLAITSPTIPMAGSIKTYTSGWARNQNKCCHNKGEPDP